MKNGFDEFTEIMGESSGIFFREFVEHMPGGFFVYRAGGREELLHLNKAALRIFGCESYEEFAELTGNTFRGMVHPDDIEAIEQSIESQISNSSEKIDCVEYRIKQKDGSTRWVTDYGRFAHTEAFGDIFYVFISDDTERMKKRMEQLEKINGELLRITARERQFRKAILYDALFFYEVSLSEDKFITAVTQARENNIYPISEIFNSESNLDGTGFTEFILRASELIGREDLKDYLAFFDRKRLLECCRSGELEQVYDRRAVDKLGKTHLLHYVVLLGKSVSDSDVTALIMVKDITEQIERQKLLRDSLRQARAAAIAKSTFLSNMSHDIKTPLNAILGFADLIKLNISDQGKTEEYLEKIRISGNQLLTIVSEALEVTRMESGKAVLAETEGNLAETLSETEQAILPEMKAKKLNFTMDTSGVRNFAVVADLVRIKEILVHLLDNSAKYTDAGGTVTLRVTEGHRQDGYGKYAFTVEDSGVGISEEFMERLFEPFARENNTTKSGVLGSGLGMTVVKNLVDLMDGTIDMDSTPGKGSRFTVTLVLRQLKSEAAAAVLCTGGSVSLKGKRVLLVEDNEINSEIAEALLTEVGFLVETASDGDIAVDAVKNSAPGYFDLVLMDIQMPRMNGYETARAIRALDDERLAGIPIIALSANTYPEDRKRSIESGMDAHAPKPLDMVRLQSLIKAVLERRTGS